MSYDKYPALKAILEKKDPIMAYNNCVKCGSRIKLFTTKGNKAKFEKAKEPVCNICVPASLWGRTPLLSLTSEERK